MNRKNSKRNFIYACVAAALLVSAAPSFAAKAKGTAAPAPQAALAARKKALLSDINARIDGLRKKQACIKVAKDKTAMRECFNPSAARDMRPPNKEPMRPRNEKSPRAAQKEAAPADSAPPAPAK